MKTISALEVRKKFGGVIDEVCESGEPVIITRGERKLVVVVPYDTYEETAGRESKLRRVSEAMAKWRKEHADMPKGADAVTLLRKIRDGR